MGSSVFGDIISSYSRADAVRDGVLIRAPGDLMADVGIVFPVCLTDSVYSGYINPSNLADMPGQSVEGRMWDLLWMLRVSIKAGDSRGDRLNYSVLFQMEPGKEPVSVDLISVCGPGDQGEPVITIMLPGED